MSWAIIEIVYVLDVLIFGYLFYYFFRAMKSAEGNGKLVMQAMAILTGVLALQELYFGINTLTDPNKLAVLPDLFPSINSIWLFAKLILTLAGATIIYTLLTMKK